MSLWSDGGGLELFETSWNNEMFPHLQNSSLLQWYWYLPLRPNLLRQQQQILQLCARPAPGTRRSESSFHYAQQRRWALAPTASGRYSTAPRILRKSLWFLAVGSPVSSERTNSWCNLLRLKLSDRHGRRSLGRFESTAARLDQRRPASIKKKELLLLLITYLLIN